MKNQASKHSLLKQVDRPQVTVSDLQPLILSKVLDVRELARMAFVLRLEKNGIEFKAGQHITIRFPNDNQAREYSIYSSEQDDFLEVLIKEVETGMVSKKLHQCKPDDYLLVEGPFGFFTLDEKELRQKHLFVASGTGIAPFHSMAGSVSSLYYTILHGIRHSDEAYENESYPSHAYISCVTSDEQGNFKGRVTNYLRANPPDFETFVYLCGNCNMIYEVYDILSEQGFPSDHIKTEVYF